MGRVFLPLPYSPSTCLPSAQNPVKDLIVMFVDLTQIPYTTHNTVLFAIAYAIYARNTECTSRVCVAVCVCAYYTATSAQPALIHQAHTRDGRPQNTISTCTHEAP